MSKTRKTAVFVLFLIFLPLARAQFTTVSGTVTDPNGLPYSFGTLNPILVFSGGTPKLPSGSPYFPPNQATGLDVNGHFVVTLADTTQLTPGGSLWNFQVCSAVGTVPAAFGKGSVCFTLAAPITISGASQSITTQLTTAALPLTNPFGSTVPAGVAAGSQLVSNGVSLPPAYQTKPFIDARDLIDCTGSTPADSALNALTGTIPGTNDALDGKVLSFSRCATISLSNTWLIKNQESFAIDCGTRSGSGGLGPTFKWTGAPGGTMIDMEYTDGFEVRGCTIFGNNIADVGINVDKTGSGGNTNTTDGRFINMTFNSNGSTRPNFVGLQISPVSISNVEDMRVEDSTFYCGGGANQVGVLIGNSANAKNEIVKHDNFHICQYAVWAKSGSVHVVDCEFSSSGGTCGSGTGADIRIDESTDVDIISGNLDEGGTQFLFGNPGHPIIIEGNHSAPAGCENLSNYWIDPQASAVPWIIYGNSWDSDANLTKLIGTANVNAQATLLTNANVYPNSTYSKWWQQGFFAIDQGQSFTGAMSSSNTLEAQRVSPGNSPAPPFSLESPYTVARSFLNGSVTTYDDYATQTIPNGSGGSGTYLIKHQQGSAGPNFFSFDGTYPGINLTQVPTPATPAIVVIGTTGGTSYTYSVVAYDGNNNTPGSTTAAVANGNATLSGTNFNQVQFIGSPGATQYCIWRTASGGSPSSTGKIGCTSALMVANSTVPFYYAVNASGTSNQYIFNDTGLAGDSSSLPSSNLTGAVQLSTVTFANLPALSNGSVIFCSDCNATCTAGASTGRTCFRENGAWTH